MRLTFVLLMFLFLMNGWNWDTHEAFVDSLYYSLPAYFKEQFILERMEEGAVAPDKTFKDFEDHSYPAAYHKTNEWLEKMKDAVDHSDWDTASYALGIASHYLSDSFSAPHNIDGESYDLHRTYEDQGSVTFYFVPCNVTSYDTEELFQNAIAQGNTWQPWVASRDWTYPKNTVQEAMEAVYLISLGVLDSSCETKKTHIETALFSLTFLDYMILSFFAGLIVIVAYSIPKHLRK